MNDKAKSTSLIRPFVRPRPPVQRSTVDGSGISDPVCAWRRFLRRFSSPNPQRIVLVLLCRAFVGTSQCEVAYVLEIESTARRGTNALFEMSGRTIKAMRAWLAGVQRRQGQPSNNPSTSTLFFFSSPSSFLTSKN